MSPDIRHHHLVLARARTNFQGRFSTNLALNILIHVTFSSVEKHFLVNLLHFFKSTQSSNCRQNDTEFDFSAPILNSNSVSQLSLAQIQVVYLVNYSIFHKGKVHVKAMGPSWYVLS